jgi:hypothetical protein
MPFRCEFNANTTRPACFACSQNTKNGKVRNQETTKKESNNAHTQRKRDNSIYELIKTKEKKPRSKYHYLQGAITREREREIYQDLKTSTYRNMGLKKREKR